MPSFVPIIVGVVLGIVCLIIASFNYYRKQIIDDLPTSKTRGVFIGLAELKGTAESESPFTSYLAGIKCVQYSWEVDEEWQRMVTTVVTDAKGNTHTQTHVETGWTRVGGGGESQPFYLKDDTGIIRIVPEGANLHGNVTFNQTVRPSDPMYYGKCRAGEIADTTHHRRFKETAIPLHVMLYILGQARERQDVVAAEIAKDKSESMFMISTKSEKQISRGYGIRYWLFMIFGLAIAVGCGAWYAIVVQPQGAPMEFTPLIYMGAGYIGALILVWVWATFNSLIGLRQRVKQGWSQVEVQLKRRHDLIPNLVQTVEGYRQHEQATQTMVAEMRTQLTATAPGVKGADFQGVAPALRIIGEKYPELKANESFLKLQQALADTENRIALARDYFNEIATFYNTRLQIIPDLFLAALAGMRPQKLMSATDFERAPVEVKLSS